MKHYWWHCVLWLALSAIPASAQQYKIRVSIEDRFLWLLKDGEVIQSGPATVGMDQRFSYQGRSWHFRTPKGIRKVTAKRKDPVWRPPDWYYFEGGEAFDAMVTALKAGQKVDLGDSTWLTIGRDTIDGKAVQVVRRTSKYGETWTWPVDRLVLTGGKLYMPPLGTKNRMIDDALGPYALDMGDGYMIHGTNNDNEYELGQPASHGCVRVHNGLLEFLYKNVPVGTPIEIF